MQKAVAFAIVLSAVGGSAYAQTRPSVADAGGGAYYEFMMGLHFEGQGDSTNALAAYQRAERLDPASAEIPAALAELYARLNRPADAVAAGERAIKANPQNPEANWILGSLYSRMAEMPTTRDTDRRTYSQRAVENLEKANRNAHPGVPMMLGRLYLNDNQYDKAIALLVPFVAEQPDQVEAVALLAEAYQATIATRTHRAARKVGRRFTGALQHARRGVSGSGPLERCCQAPMKAPCRSARNFFRCARNGPRRS
jgi:predicted Zn-dependent protease